jgi:hypothetical protein
MNLMVFHENQVDLIASAPIVGRVADGVEQQVSYAQPGKRGSQAPETGISKGAANNPEDIHVSRADKMVDKVFP